MSTVSLAVRRVGRVGLLLELPDLEAVLALAKQLRAAADDGQLPGVEIIPAARTILLHADDTRPDLDELRERVTRLAEFGSTSRSTAGSTAGSSAGSTADSSSNSTAGSTHQPAHDEGAPITIPVRYDGPDLVEVCGLTGLSRSEVIDAHTGHIWRAAFIGFAPGFCYLTGGDPRLTVPRRGESRTTVPGGSVAIAGGYSAIYPADSPGGWLILGTTTRPVWEPSAAEPTLIRPGCSVRFVAVDGLDSRTEAHPPARVADSVSAAEPAAVRRGLVVRRPGPLTLVQDAGRRYRAAIGVGRSGAADRSSYRLANDLVGNLSGAAALECTFGGLVIRARGDHVVALTGASASAGIDGRKMVHGAAVELLDGQTLTLASPRVGLRTYLAVRGGVDAAPFVGSRSTDVLSGLGPPPLRAGDVLPVGSAVAAERPTAAPPLIITAGVVQLNATLGPRHESFSNPDVLAVGEWVVSPQSNRVGLRLDRPDEIDAPVLQRRSVDELPSEGMVLGSIQVPPSGQPVLFLADHPVTGGYPVVAVVEQADVDRAAQVRPGQRIRLHLTS